MMLHPVNKSPFERNALESCLRLAASGASVLLIEDGVIAALAGTRAGETIAGRAGDLKFYVLGPDIDARGLGDRPLADGVEVVDYGGFVDLVVAHDAVNAWL